MEVADLSNLVNHPCSDMVVDRQGQAYIGNIGFDFGKPDAPFSPAPILLVTRDNNPGVVADGLAFPNGMVITPDGQTLIVAESYAACLTTSTPMVRSRIVVSGRSLMTIGVGLRPWHLPGLRRCSMGSFSRHEGGPAGPPGW